eukprot:230641-Rhodomonas_salina.1
MKRNTNTNSNAFRSLADDNPKITCANRPSRDTATSAMTGHCRAPRYPSGSDYSKSSLSSFKSLASLQKAPDLLFVPGTVLMKSGTESMRSE